MSTLYSRSNDPGKITSVYIHPSISELIVYTKQSSTSDTSRSVVYDYISLQNVMNTWTRNATE
jgi:hypothetical protein